MNFAIAVAVASALVAAAAVLVYLRQAGIARSSALDNAFGTLTSCLMAHPELRPILYEDDPGDPSLPGLEDPRTRLRASIGAEQLCDALELSLGRDRSARYVRSFVGQAFLNSRYLTQWLLRHRGWYDPRLVRLAESAAKEHLWRDAPSTAEGT